MNEHNHKDICVKQYEKISSLEFWKNITLSKPKSIMVYIEGKNARDPPKENWKIGKLAEQKTLRDGNKNKNTNIRKLLVVKEGNTKNTR